MKTTETLLTEYAVPWTAELKLAELLGARLCDDMASPRAAIDNGRGLWKEWWLQGSPRALELISSSAAEVVVSLCFLRSAFGVFGEITGRATQVRDLAFDWLRLR